MQLGMTMRINGSRHPSSAWTRCWRRNGSATTRCGAGEAWGTDAVSPIAWVLARTTKHQGRHRHHADAGAHAGLRRDDRDDAASAVRRAFSAAASARRVRRWSKGWHGVAYGKPLGRTKEYIEIIRKVVAREAPLDVRRASTIRSPIAALVRPASASR